MTTQNTGVLRRWATDLAMGARFAFGGGREGWTRTLLTALGVGLGVTLLLFAASIPHLLNERDARVDARTMASPERAVPASDDSVLYVQQDTVYHGEEVVGVLLQPDGDSPPVPPGLSELPDPGERVVSPALQELLQSPEGKLLRERLDGTTVGTIGAEGLTHPHELVYYAGADDLKADGYAYRVDHYSGPEENWLLQLRPQLLLLVVVGSVTLLLPVAAFIAAAVRFGGERRDRRLAALRLVGADSQTTRRVAAGESAVGALLGLAVGAALFLPLRQFVDDVQVLGISAFPSDVTPTPLLIALIVIAVPACAVMVSLFTLRNVAIEPLGVVRQAVGRRRRLVWRLVLPAVGLVLLLLPTLLADQDDASVPTFPIVVGVILVLGGVTAMLPWLVEATVRRMRGGGLPFQLAVRRLQLDSGMAARAVSGITVAVAGAVALQMLFAGVADQQTHETGRGDDWNIKLQVDHDEHATAEVLRELRATPGVRRAVGIASSPVQESGKKEPAADQIDVYVADCSSLKAYAELGSCRNGDVFLTSVSGAAAPGSERPARPGMTLDLQPFENRHAAELWTVPEDARAVEVKPDPDPNGFRIPGVLVLATPAAIDASHLCCARVEAFVRTDPGAKDAVEHVRNTAAEFGRGVSVRELRTQITSKEFAAVKKGLYVGAIAVLLLIGASMIVSTLEQLRERKRLLSVLVAFGTRRSTLAWSVLWQTAVPVLLGLTLAAATGVGLGTVLMDMAQLPVAVDWPGLGTMTGLGALLIAVVTVLSMPALWRLMRPDGLRTE